MNVVNNSRDVIYSSGIVFGTSGARGLVKDFTPQVCAAFTVSFVAVMQEHFSFDTVALAIDNRQVVMGWLRRVLLHWRIKALTVFLWSGTNPSFGLSVYV